MQTFFLDESGELGQRPQSSLHFIIALVQTEEPKRLKNAIRKEKLRLYDLGWPRSLEIKGNHLHACHRFETVPPGIVENRSMHLQRLAARIVGTGSRIHFSVVRKDRLSRHLRQAPYGIAYNYLTGSLLSKVHGGRLNDDITLVVDRRNKETHHGKYFDGYIETRIVSECMHEHDFNIIHADSADWTGLLAVDIVSWGLFRHYEFGDTTYSSILFPHVGVQDNWYAGDAPRKNPP